MTPTLRRPPPSRPPTAPPLGGARPHLHHVHVGHDGPREGGGTTTAARSTTSCRSSQGLDLGTTTCVLDVPPLPPDGPLRLHDLGALARKPVELRAGFSASGFWEDIGAPAPPGWATSAPSSSSSGRTRPRPGDRDHRSRARSDRAPHRELMVPWEERFGVMLHEVYGSTRSASARASGPATHASSGRWGSRAARSRSRSWTRTTIPPPGPGRGVRLGHRRSRSRSSRATGSYPGDRRCDAQPLVPLRRRRADRPAPSLRVPGPDQGHDPAPRREHLVVRGRARGPAEPGVVECAAYAVPAEGAPTEEDVMIAVVAGRRSPRPGRPLPRALPLDAPLRRPPLPPFPRRAAEDPDPARAEVPAARRRRHARHGRPRGARHLPPRE